MAHLLSFLNYKPHPAHFPHKKPQADEGKGQVGVKQDKYRVLQARSEKA
jgi:hypothetical protein